MEGKNSNPVETNEKDYLEEINRLKENSVSKEDYQKIKKYKGTRSDRGTCPFVF